MADSRPRRELNLKKVAAAQKRKAEEENISTSDSDAEHREMKSKKKHDPRAADILARKQQQSDYKSSDPDVEQHVTSSSAEETNMQSYIRPFDSYPTLKTRTCPSLLVDAIENLNPIQKQQVRDIGFGALLNLKISNIPLKLAYWLLENFDSKRCEIQLKGNAKVHIREDDVRMILGLQRGERLIQSRIKNHESSLTVEWRQRFEKASNRILLKHVYTNMLEQREGGEWFKRQFLVLLTTCLIECFGNGYLSPQIMDNLNDIDKVSELNWCQYVIRSLTKHTSHWQKKKKNYYTGPTLFLTLFYVDRVVLSYRTVPRSIPATIKWTNELITERQSMEIVGGGFEEGFPDKPCTVDEILNPDLIDNELINAAAPNQVVPNEEHIVDKPEPHNPSEPPCEQPGPSNAELNIAEPSQDNQDMHSVTDKLISMTKMIYDTFTNIITLIDALPEKMLENAILRRTLERALLLDEKQKKPSEQSSSQEEDDFWSNPEHIAAIAKIEEAAMMRNEFKKKFDDVPSFNLGLSQDIWEDVINVVDDIEKTSRKESTTEDKNKEDASLAKEIENQVEGDNEVQIETEEEQNKNDLVEDDPKTIAKKDKGKGKMHAEEDIEMQEQVKEKETDRMVTRNKTLLKKTDILMSPYYRMTIIADEKLDKKQKYLYFWMMSRSESNREDIVYNDGPVQLRRQEMETMRAGRYLNISVIDVWSTILNHNEKLRSMNSPKRFFATTNPCLYTIVNAPKKWDTEKRISEFSNRLLGEIQAVEGLQVAGIEMNCKGDIIDNSVELDGENIDQNLNYGDIPCSLVRFLIEFLKKNGEGMKASTIDKKMKPTQKLQMPWQNNTNKVDCGIYVMRHMETYKGNGMKNWKSGLKVDNLRQMKFLRAKYCVTVLDANSNNLRADILAEATFHYAASCEDGLININEIVLCEDNDAS
ncbi:hypothetical protein C2S52_011741 [Perilla frutescens var. hirtella]|nr:hypothetical protein C2S52_011741 [Perilla frutescens var. hirtella]